MSPLRILRHILVILLLLVELNTGEEQLELVSVVFRHGDRSPIIAYPNDPYQEEAWPQGFGQLTIEGMKEEYHLGQLLKSRYIDSRYMNTNYTRQEVYVRSTDYDRTLMSAQCVLAGLYPINNTFINGLNWQPIPVHTTPPNYDILLGQVECPLYVQLLEKDKPVYDKINIDNEELFGNLTDYTGEIVNTSSVGLITDALFVEYTHNLSMPSWFNIEMLKKLKSLDDIYFQLQANTEKKRQLTGGVWANKVLQDIENKINDKSSKMKLYLYSAHDTTVSAMLSVFDLFNGLQPPYSSAFIIELYSNNNNYYVKFLYHNETWSNTLIELIHPNCTNNCTIHNIQQIMDPFRLNESQWVTVCSPTSVLDDSSFSLWTILTIALSVAVFLLVMVLLVTVSLIIKWKCCKSSSTNNYILVPTDDD